MTIIIITASNLHTFEFWSGVLSLRECVMPSMEKPSPMPLLRVTVCGGRGGGHGYKATNTELTVQTNHSEHRALRNEWTMDIHTWDPKSEMLPPKVHLYSRPDQMMMTTHSQTIAMLDASVWELHSIITSPQLWSINGNKICGASKICIESLKTSIMT